MNQVQDNSLPIFTDDQTRRLYANDASMYEELPYGVAFPKNLHDIQQLLLKARQEQVSITARSAGTSLAGQTTGGGIVMDVSRHMNQILELNPEKKYAHVQPGVIRDTLNRQAQQYQLLFGPDTATTNRCMLGGMIGNNSCGSFSIKHKTTREHVLEIEAILSDGSKAVFKPLTPKELEQKKQLDTLEGRIYRGMLKLIEENREQILAYYPHPEIIRRNTGYALDKLCTMRPFDPKGRPFNLAELLCGSEGTLAMTASAKVSLVPLDNYKVLLVPHFNTIRDAMVATNEAVNYDPAAVELVDHIILDATKSNLEQKKNRFFLEGDPECILIIQFEGNDYEELLDKAESLRQALTDRQLSTAAPLLTDVNKVDRVWDLRKAGLGLLMGLGADAKSPTFCEDTAVRVQDLPDYIDEFQAILNKYDTNCVFYAHASVGELHLRPVVDIKSPEGLQKLKDMADEIAALVHKYKGSLSGEHGDGRARAPYIEKVLGSEMMPLLRQVKELWDPNYLFNPGKIINPQPIDTNLRYSPAYQPPQVDTVFNWRKEKGFENALELCNGAGVCRKLAESGGTMCPSYMATKEEKDSTRGRANLFRQLFAGKGPEAFDSDELRDALDLCISCKGCKSECPANVDMAKMKAEFMHGWHQQHGISLAERFFGHAGKLYPLASIFPAMSNWLMQSPVGKELMQQFAGVHPKRILPAFAATPFMKWFKKRPGRLRSDQKVFLLVDIFTNYHEPEIAKAAVSVLEALGLEVLVPEVTETGRPQLSKGMLDDARQLANVNIKKLHPYAQQGIPIIGLEPSEILTLRDEYLDLCDDDLQNMASVLASRSYQFEEYFTHHLLEYPEKSTLFDGGDKPVHLHGHCHAKALVGNTPTLEALEAVHYKPSDLQTGCCGMAGSFGYEANHYETSMDIGELVLFPALRQTDGDELICAPGFSCRHQINDGTGRQAYHPAQLIYQTMRF